MSIAFLSENMLSVCFGKNDIYGVLAREVTSYKSLTTVFDDALALEMTVGKETWEPNTNLDYSQVVGSFTSSVPIRAKQRSKLA